MTCGTGSTTPATPAWPGSSSACRGSRPWSASTSRVPMAADGGSPARWRSEPAGGSLSICRIATIFPHRSRLAATKWPPSPYPKPIPQAHTPPAPRPPGRTAGPHSLVGMLATRFSRVAAVAWSTGVGLGLVGCGSPAHSAGSSASPASAPSTQRTVPSPSVASPSPTRCAVTIAPGFSCLMQQRISEAQRYLATQPGHIGIVLYDRTSRATWRNVDASTDFPAASTIKLAMVLDLMLRNRAGSIQLDAGDWDLIGDILSESSDTAADQLWGQFEDSSFLSRIHAFGMAGTYFTTSPAYWGFIYCSAQDLDNLMNYILNDAPATVSAYIPSRMRQVAPIQQWGVWGAGPANQIGRASCRERV